MNSAKQRGGKSARKITAKRSPKSKVAKKKGAKKVAKKVAKKKGATKAAKTKVEITTKKASKTKRIAKTPPVASARKGVPKRKAPAVIASVGDALPRASRRLLDDLEGTALRALDHLRERGVEHAEISVSQGEQLETGVRQGEIELIKEAKSSGLGVRVVHNERVATSSTTDLAPEALERFLDRVIEMAELSETDPLAVPPDPKELMIGAKAKFPALDLWDDKIAKIKADRALRLALAGEKAAFAADRRITSSEGASCSRGASHSVLASSGGFVGRTAGTHASLVVHVVADDEGGKKRNGFEWTAGRHFEMLMSPAAVGREAASRAVRSLGSIKLETGVYPVVFEREAARAIVGLVASCVVGDAIYRAQSYLGDRLGTAVASSKVTIVDDPLVPRGPGSRMHDGEGRAVRRNTVISGGELRSFLLDTYSARKLKLAPTGSAGGGGGIPHATTSNFYMKAGRAKPESLLRGIERGLFVTSMMGFGFDPVTGNFSRGASGFLIENGELTVPVSEVTISRNLDELLKGIDAVANDLEHRASISAPSFRVDHMTVSGR
ncbi:TldD/PmbA family protein [Enhygromyxa salina]|uniref:Peptidase PmbA n=1 Tax=Enhygromyxa salina TaxID=215803 RepID=A0A2S9Y392_9BACT|nr:TldD/PmbA family protein [Enhygromyxa salina]PRP99573.1 peptidase PmbA [Enhygromyxa salina]